MSQQTARKFMQVAERFGKTRIDTCFNSTQMIAMLALPEGEEEKFIAEKTAEGKRQTIGALKIAKRFGANSQTFGNLD